LRQDVVQVVDAINTKGSIGVAGQTGTTRMHQVKV
jgi:hypothetical protein